MSKKTKRGGKRAGAGRPRLPESERQRQLNIRLYPHEFRELLRFGVSPSQAIMAILREKGVISR